MEVKEKIALAEENIRQALADYGRYTTQTEVLDDVSECFITKLARDNYYAKQELRELFRKSPVWDEKLDALIINGTRTHEPDYDRIKNLAKQILEDPMHNWTEKQYCNIQEAIRFFYIPDLTDEEKAKSIEAINALAPKAYADGKKLSRVFRALCVALGVTENKNFNYLYAQFADEITSHKIDFKLFVSLNPAHFITMSNPKNDERGCTLTSCHSFNSTEYSYNNGCTGYARDNYTFIVFTVLDPTNVETLNNRKNMRQIFCYKPGNGLLLQSRLYNDAGGTHRAFAESKIYRDLIQREISALEEQPNLWKTFKYYDNGKVNLYSGCGFGGYEDWKYQDFAAMVSIRNDRKDDFEEFQIGTYGLCIKCGCEISEGLYCYHCKDSTTCCDCCGEYYDEDELHYVYDENGDEIRVCDDCSDRYYVYCDECESYHYYGNMSYVQNDECYVCQNCLDHYYTYCERCDELVHIDSIMEVYNEYGDEEHVCVNCAHHYYRECEHCNRMFHEDVMQDGLCPDCLSDAERAKEDEETVKEEIVYE